MSDVFISYAREDKDKAELLARVFEQQKWSVWWDKVIPPGRKYADVIGAELDSAKAVIVLWSTASVASDWVKDEAQEGVTRGILVPALIDKVQPPYGFRQVQTADLSDWNGAPSHPELQGLVSGIADLIKKPVSPSPLPLPLPQQRTDPGKRRLLYYLLAGGVLVLLLGFGAYRFFKNPESDPNRVVNGRHEGGPTPCNLQSHRQAADITSKGLMMIDPGGNQTAAVLQFNEAISECPDYTDAYFWRGQSLVALQQSDKAVADFKTVVAIATDADMRQKAEKFIADLEGPHSTPTAVPVNMNANTSNQGTPHSDPVHAQVNEMFGADKSTRIAATTRLIIERKQDPATVQMSVSSALAHPDNKSGVINTLVYLENVDPTVLKHNKDDIQKLLTAVNNNGSQTNDHAKKVQDLLDK